MKPDNNLPQAVFDLVRSVRDIQQRPAQQYGSVVDDVLRIGSRDDPHIERTLDRLPDFCVSTSVQI